MLARLYSFLWLLLHLLVCVYEKLRWLSCRLHAATIWSYDFCSSKTSNAHKEINFLEHCKTQLSKLPRHLNIIVGPDDTQIGDDLIARIFNYALIMDISYVSLYDTRRIAGSRHAAVEKLPVPKGIHCYQLQGNRFVWTTSTTHIGAGVANGKKLQLNGSSNGEANGHCNPKDMVKSIEIFEITIHDGRPLIAEVCRELFEQQRSAETKQLILKEDRTKLGQRITDELSQRLQKLPDPELSIVFNSQTCTYGLLPWQTRFTEFQTIDTAHYFNAETFARVLYRYSRCEQRWGK